MSLGLNCDHSDKDRGVRLKPSGVLGGEYINASFINVRDLDCHCIVIYYIMLMLSMDNCYAM